MTAPTLAFSSASNTGGGSVANVNPTLSSASAGDLLVVITAASGPGNEFAASIDEEASGTRWHKETSDFRTSGFVTGLVFWKIAEGSDALHIRPNVAVRTASISLTFTGHGRTLKSAVTNGSSTNADPPSCTQGGSAQDTMVIAAACIAGTVVASAAPAGFGTLTTSAAASGLGASVSVASKTGNLTNDDPGGFTSTNAAWVTFTLLIGSTAIDTPARVTQVTVEVLSSNDDVAVASDAALVGFFL